MCRRVLCFRASSTAGVYTADQRVGGEGGVVSVFLTKYFFVLRNDIGVFAVGGEVDWALAEEIFQGLETVDQHVAGRGAHIDFYAADIRRVDGFDFVEVVEGGPEVEGVVGGHFFGGTGKFVFEPLVGDGRWAGVGHFHHRGDAARDGGGGFAGHIAFLGEAGFAEVNVAVDHAGQKRLARRVDHDVRVGGNLGESYGLRSRYRRFGLGCFA